jgi:hypothetical protein
MSIYDVSTLPIPRLPRCLREELTSRIQKASALRVEANRLLDEAERMIYQQNQIERSSEGRGQCLCTFSSSYQRIIERHREEGYQRLDSKYYDPIALEIRERIKQCSSWNFLGNISAITLIGKTFVPGVNKVEKEYGIPYFTGKELFRARITPDTFITSKNKADIERLIVSRGTTLVTCAGTSGKVAYVGGQLEGTTVTRLVRK